MSIRSFCHFLLRMSASATVPVWSRRLVVSAVLVCASMSAYAGEVLDRIRDEHSLKVCIWPLRKGLLLRDWRTQSLSGVDFELSQELAKSLGVRVEYIDSTYSSMQDDLEQSRCDIAMFGLTIRPVSPDWPIAYSRPYLYSSVYAVVMKGNRLISTWKDVDQKGVMIGVLDRSIAQSWIGEHFKLATTVLVSSPIAREKDLQAGRIDLFLTDQIFGLRVVEVFDWVSVLPPRPDGPKLPFGYAVKANDDQWLQWVNQFIDTVRRDGRLAAAAKRHGLTSMLEE